MSKDPIAHQELLMRAAEKLWKTPSTTDHLMLTKWRVQSICQYLFGGSERGLEGACRTALETFAIHGPCAACDEALKVANDAIKQIEMKAGGRLPSLSKEKCVIVAGRLDDLTANTEAAIKQALLVLPIVRERMRKMGHAASSLGVRHRFELVAAILENSARSESERSRAAAAVLYVNEERNVIPDTLGVIGMVDDNYALLAVLEEINGSPSSAYLHWSERIGSLWDELPFLQGVNLKRGEDPISVTWLDRVNSYVSYSHVMGAEKSPLVLLQPSIACSPLHVIVTLIGLLVLDAVTSSQSKAQALREGQTYEFDNFVARFEGIAGPPEPGWLRLRMRDGVIYHPPGLADRMVPIKPRRLSCLQDFSSQANTANTDPIQSFFDWEAAIGAASISSHLILVASRRRVIDLLGDVESNGVHLLEHGLVRFVGEAPEDVETHGTLVFVVPSLSTARLILDRGIHAQAIVIDGYERLYRGRHELPFLINRHDAPSIIGWSVRGYYPVAPLVWLEPYKLLQVPPDDLAAILELEDISTDIGHASLWEAATGGAVQIRVTHASLEEIAVLAAINEYLRTLHSSRWMPDYWQYQLTAFARTLRTLISATPAEWSEIRRYASLWSSSIEERRSSLRPSAIAALSELLETEKHVLKLIENIPAAVNSRVTALAEFLSDYAQTEDKWYLVCDHPEQIKAAASAVRALGLRTIEPILLRDLAVCSACVVTGWINSSFARRLWAHTPRKFFALTDDIDGRRWEHAIESQRRAGGQSLLNAVGGIRSTPLPISPITAISEDQDQTEDHDLNLGCDTDERVPCLFLSVIGQSKVKILEPNGRVVVEEDNVVRERVAARLCPDDRVILGIGASRWSPADEFTSSVIDAVEESHPEVVKMAREWRRALREFVEVNQVSIPQLRAQLALAGIEREEQTIVCWLDSERPSPIAPRRQRVELNAIWPIIEQYAQHPLDDIAYACARLRTLRVAAGHALLQLWKGLTVDVGVDAAWLDNIVDRLRSEVQIYEIEAVTVGKVPGMMLGWWISPALVERFEVESEAKPVPIEVDVEDD